MNLIPPTRLAVVGRVFFATAIIFFGVQHLIYAEFVTRLMPPWPQWIPLRSIWPPLVGVALIAAGGLILAGKFARVAALLLGAVVLISAVLLALPFALSHPNWGGEWTNAGKALSLGGGALLLATSLPGSLARSCDRKFALVGRVCFSAFLILCGIQHFIWVQYVVTLVPAWIPGALFWTYLAGVALIAGGLGLLLRPTARLAGWLTSLMIFLWLILLHIPRALADLHNANESTAVFEALAMTSIALLLALVSAGDSSPGRGLQPTKADQ